MASEPGGSRGLAIESEYSIGRKVRILRSLEFQAMCMSTDLDILVFRIYSVYALTGWREGRGEGGKERRMLAIV